MKFCSYLRVSTRRQGQSGLGLEAQRETVLRYMRETDGELLEEFVEVETGRADDRPVLRAALARCKQLKATLVIAKLDRISRNVAFIAGLMNSGVEFRALDAPYANRFMLHILAAVAEHEREQISARTKAALAAAKARGVQLGRHGQVLADQNRARAREFARSLSPELAEVLLERPNTFLEIANGLNARDVRSAEGSRWYPATVARLLSRLEDDEAVAEWQAARAP